METQYVWVVLVTNDDRETWIEDVCDTEDTANHAVKQFKQQLIYDGVCADEDEVDTYYHVLQVYTPIKCFEGIALAAPPIG